MPSFTLRVHLLVADFCLLVCVVEFFIDLVVAEYFQTEHKYDFLQNLELKQNV